MKHFSLSPQSITVQPIHYNKNDGTYHEYVPSLTSTPISPSEQYQNRLQINKQRRASKKNVSFNLPSTSNEEKQQNNNNIDSVSSILDELQRATSIGSGGGDPEYIAMQEMLQRKSNEANNSDPEVVHIELTE